MLLMESREGVNLTSKEAKEMADIVGPLLKQGLSPYQIIATHPELGICEKTLYSWEVSLPLIWQSSCFPIFIKSLLLLE